MILVERRQLIFDLKWCKAPELKPEDALAKNDYLRREFDAKLGELLRLAEEKGIEILPLNVNNDAQQRYITEAGADLVRLRRQVEETADILQEAYGELALEKAVRQERESKTGLFARLVRAEIERRLQLSGQQNH